MPSYKRIDGDYTISTVNTTDRIIIQATTTEIQGNLDVSGNLTYINVEELNIRDPFILINSSNTGSYAANSGLLTHRTSTDYAGLRYNNNTATWQVSSSTGVSGDTGTWTDIQIGSGTAAGANTEIQFNDSGAFGASGNLKFDRAINRLTLQGHQVLGNIGTPPAATANAVTLFHNEVSTGGSGVYFRDAGTTDELVSRAKAIVFAIIF